MSIIISIILGAISGWLASIIMHTKGGLIRNIILGIVGGFVGNGIFDLLHISLAGYLGTVIISVIGACIVVFIVNKIFK